ncbi:hypothetical protein [Paludisphaera mucosa]|uniref:Tetratricopeptide repeat protein n=1 Tax=Paludisphaera mucosa TaxID=3030827 RepID=A0ABT6F7Q2_9BACT|nr:hypothetical protein [Paludisphaera mucosa]MDG3003590.1 hypothetical protein [Paludisphaera mucosa]
MRRAWILAAFVLASPPLLLACLWDRDTPADEAKGLPDVVAVLTGRFPRNPPLFYEMRLERVEKRLIEHPRDLAAYDDAGVACDRLGRGDEAIAWMERKRKLLDTWPDGAESREHTYRYHANLGTFLVHRWVRAGADRAKLDEVRSARDEIARAIAINPDAHFGRESYQLRFLDWLLTPPPLAGFEDLPNFLGIRDQVEVGAMDPAEARKAVLGLSGLIVLGNAWESIDVYNALKMALGQDTQGFSPERAGGRNSLAYYAWLRCKELIQDGRGSMIPDAPRGEALTAWIRRPDFVQLEDVHEAPYHDLRREADAWQEARTRFMTARLQQGRHPDDDPEFWTGYTEPPPPSLPAISPSVSHQQAMNWRILRAKFVLGGIGAVVLGLVLSPLWIRLFRRRRGKAATIPEL